MKISIAVPSFNYGNYLSDCLESILRQSHKNFEVLICDGGSIDESLQVIDRFCSSDGRFKLISRTDNGQSDAINKAFLESDGEILCFLNADDKYISCDVLSRVVEAFSIYYQLDIVSFQGYYIDTNGRNLDKVNLRYHPFDSFAQMKYRTAVLQPSTFWKREVYFDTPFRPGFELSFDSVFFYECYLKYNWLELPTPVSGYRWHSSNKSALVSSCRVRELINFEKFKFGFYSYRVFYLKYVLILFLLIEKTGKLSSSLQRFIRIIVNGLSYTTFYRLPSI